MSRLVSAAALCSLISFATLAAPASTTFAVEGNVPGFIKNAKDLGPVDPAAQIDVTVWLKLHNENQLDQLVSQQNTKGHPNFHKWITQAAFDAQFSPTAQEVKSVQNFLSAHKLTAVETAENNFYVKVRGTVADVEKAFHVQIDNFSLDGSTFRANTANPSVNDSSGAHVAAITGLDDFGFQPKNVRPVNPDGSPARGTPLTSNPQGTFATGACFRPPETRTF